MADYVPNSEGELKGWLTNLMNRVPSRTVELEITPARLTKINDWCDGLLGAIQVAEEKKSDWLAASKTKQTQEKASLAGLRDEVAKWKTADGMTDAIAAEMRIVGGNGAFNPESHQTEIKAEVFSGYVRIKFKKGQADGINLYSRLKGQAEWKFVARDTNSPYDDHTPLAVPGAPEVREYQAFGVLNDEQIGVASDIVVVNFAG